MIWQMSQSELIITFGFVCCFTYIIGWLSDGILKSSGFGHIGNWLLLLVGAYASMYGFNMYGYKFEWYPLFTLTIVSGFTCMFFLSMCIGKRLFY